MRIKKDYSRKSYSNYQYRDWMRAPTAKAIWNNILERFSGLGEFSRSTLTPLQRSIQRYIQQSDFKKPYLSEDFVQMEDDWEGPGSGISYHPIDSPKYDQPWNLQVPVPPPFTTVFDVESDSCYCPGESRPFEITGTHPIEALTITFSDPDTFLSGLSGFGSNSVSGDIFAGDDQGGFVTIEASMLSSEGVAGDSNINIFECDDCDPCPAGLVPGSNPLTMGRTTIAISVNGGQAPYNWSLLGCGVGCTCAGFSLGAAVTVSQTNTLTATNCGTARVQVTDNCGDTVNFNIRCTFGAWRIISGACVLGPVASNVPGQPIFLKDNFERQFQAFRFAYFCSGAASCNCSNSSPGCQGTGGGGTPCIFGDCSFFPPYTVGTFPCCESPPVDCQGIDYFFTHYQKWCC